MIELLNTIAMIRMLCCFLSRNEKEPQDVKNGKKGKKDGTLVVLRPSKKRSGKGDSGGGGGCCCEGGDGGCGGCGGGCGGGD